MVEPALHIYLAHEAYNFGPISLSHDLVRLYLLGAGILPLKYTIMLLYNWFNFTIGPPILLNLQNGRKLTFWTLFLYLL
jgi:hypothetical protein